MASFLTQPKSILSLGKSTFPQHYGDAKGEYTRLGSTGGFLEDQATAWLKAMGPDAMSFLQGMLTLNVRSIKIGHSQSGFALDASGKIIVFLEVCRVGFQEYWLACPDDTIDQLETHLSRFIIMEDLILSKMPGRTTFTLIGPDAENQVKGFDTDENRPVFACRRAGLPAFVFPLERNDAPAWLHKAQEQGIDAIGWEAFQQARIEAFEPQFPLDIQPETNPVIYHLEDAISDNKGCYIGQETVAMTRDRGRPPYVLALLSCTSSNAPSSSIELFSHGKAIGYSHSITFSSKTHSFLRIGVVKFKVMANGLDFLEDQLGNRWQIDQFNYPNAS